MTSTPSVGLRLALEAAKEMDSKLSAHDFKNHYVKVDHDDGSSFLFNWAFYILFNNEWYLVFTEHHGYHAFHKEDVAIEEMEVVNAGVFQEENHVAETDE